jgi:hypothetical protein
MYVGKHRDNAAQNGQSIMQQRVRVLLKEGKHVSCQWHFRAWRKREQDWRTFQQHGLARDGITEFETWER